MQNLEQLRTTEMNLAMEIDNLQHELRRVSDGLERGNGAGRELELKSIRLKESIELCRKDLKTNQMQQADLFKHEDSQ
jgi:hypothetical protein